MTEVANNVTQLKSVQRWSCSLWICYQSEVPSNSQQHDFNGFHSVHRLLSGLILKTTTSKVAAHLLIRIFQRQVYRWNKRPGSPKARAAGKQGFHTLRSDSWQALALRSMAEAHLEMDDGSTLPLIRICHTADGDRALHAGSYWLQRGAGLSDQSPPAA